MASTYEHVGNLHIHTPYSDGHLYHAQIAEAAGRAGLDFVIITDHNVRVGGVEGYYSLQETGRVLLLTGEEVHDTRRTPPGNHLLVYGVEDEMASYGPSPQELIDQVHERGGFSFLAHPFERPADASVVDEPVLSWHNWEVEGYTGIELWNYMSEFKSLITSRRSALRYAYNPQKGIRGPFPETLEHWDNLLREGQRVRAIGGADAHGATFSLGPLRRKLFPYEYLFRCVNTHIVTPHNLEGILEHDRRVIEGALRAGHAFVGYDLPASTRGFRFTAQGLTQKVMMGDWIRLEHGVTLQVVVPQIADARLICNGEVVQQEIESTHMTHIATQPGAYRVEVYIRFEGELRGWIFSNPIFVV
jgi:hypothetical protein